MRDRLAFLHIPKCAGTSVTTALAAHLDEALTVPWPFGRDHFGGFDRLDEVERLILPGEAVDLAGYRYLAGHYSLPEILTAFDPDEVLCLLREPRSRLLSHVTYWRSWTEDEHASWAPYDASRAASQPLEAFLGDASVAHQVDNLICRTILGPDPRVPVAGFIDAADVEGIAADVCRALDDIGFVDVIERGPVMHRSLESWLGVGLTLERLNRTADDRLVGLAEPEVHELLNLRSAADLIVWEHVMSRPSNDVRGARASGDAAYGSAVARLSPGRDPAAPGEPGEPADTIGGVRGRTRAAARRLLQRQPPASGR